MSDESSSVYSAEGGGGASGEPPTTTGKIIEVWVLPDEVLELPEGLIGTGGGGAGGGGGEGEPQHQFHFGNTKSLLVKQFAAKLEPKHAHGQWLICDWQQHDMSTNVDFKGFQKIFRMKYKPTKFRKQAHCIVNSDNNTDSEPLIWGHVQKVLMEMCAREVYVERKGIKIVKKR